MNKDIELNPIVSEVKQEGASVHSETPYLSNESNANMTRFEKFKDSFKRQSSEEEQVGKQLSKSISQRHLITLALITGVGTGLMVGTGSVLHNAGPSQLILGFAIVGSYLYPTLQAAGELAINYSDLSGGFNYYPRIFVDPSLNYAVSVQYAVQWLCVISVELVTAAMTIQFWDVHQKINPDVWVAILFIVIVSIHLIGARGYGEAEFIIGCTKLTMLCGFIIMGICVTCGANPRHEFIGGSLWVDHWNFKGLCSVFVTGSFALGQSEFIALTAAEQSNPRKAIPMACKLILWKVCIFFLVSLSMVGLLVPYTSDRLMGSAGGKNHASPFVLAAQLHGVKAVPSIINAVILLSVTSVASSALYSASRTLQSLAEQGSFPSYFNYIDKRGRPLRTLIFCSICGIFSFIAAYKKQETVFAYLLSISGLSQIFTWNIICLSHVRFRAALKYNNISTDSLGYVSGTGVWGSVYAIIWHWLIIIAQFWIALFPVGSSKPSVENFFQNYLAPIFFLICYIGHKIWTRNWRLFYRVDQIDVYTNRILFDEEVLNLERKEAKEQFSHKPWYKKIFHFLFQ